VVRRDEARLRRSAGASGAPKIAAMPTAPFRSDRLDEVRLSTEAAMQARVIERFALERAAAAVPEEAHVQERRALDAHRALFVHVTPRTAPRLYRIAHETLEKLGLPTRIELLIDPSETINAGSLPLPRSGDAPILSLTSGAVRRLDERQLACVLGHEAGHLAYGHTLLRRWVRMIYREVAVPELLEGRLRILRRLQELSCDRTGALAVDMNLEVAAETELLVATGLGPEHVELDLEAYAGEVARIESFDVPQHLFELSHPLLPIRLRALQLFAEGADEERILELVRLMDFEASTPAARHQRDLLLAGGLLAAHASVEEGGDGENDTELDDAARARLVDLVLPFSDDPEGELAEVETRARALELFTTSAEWLRLHAGPERFELIAQLIEVTLGDGRATEGEVRFLLDAGERLDVPAAWIGERLERHAEAALRTPGAPRQFGLRQDDA